MHIVLVLCALSVVAMARQHRLYGYVVDTDNRGIEFVNAYVRTPAKEESVILTGTTTNKNGYYDLQFDCDDSITVVFSMIGYQTIEIRMKATRDVQNINVELPSDAEALAEIEVRGLHRQQGQMDRVDALVTRVMPDASGSIESLLITFTGVTQNNELSSQYNVRGGSFDENSVYVNGIEVHRPLLIRAGQQEGLSFVNPDMTQTVDFSAGGFDARYADKMASVLDITYKRPKAFEASVTASLLGVNGYVGFGNDRYTQMHGIRYKTSRYFLSMLPTKATYNPDFVDYQTMMTWRVGSKGSKGSKVQKFKGSRVQKFDISKSRYIIYRGLIHSSVASRQSSLRAATIKVHRTFMSCLRRGVDSFSQSGVPRRWCWRVRREGTQGVSQTAPSRQETHRRQPHAGDCRRFLIQLPKTS